MEKIIDIFKQFSGYALIAVAGVLAGLFIGLNTAGKSCYLEIIYGEETDGSQKIIRLNKNDITDFDYENLKTDQANVICGKIEELKYNAILSKKLRYLRDMGIGPFQSRFSEVFLKFTKNKPINANIAGAYSGYLLNKEISITGIIEPENAPFKIDEMRDFKVLIKLQKPANFDETIDGKTIWIDKDFAYDWLKITDKKQLPERLKAKASIDRTVVFLESKKLVSQKSQIMRTNFFSERAFN